MEKKTLITAIIILALLFSAVAGTQFVSLGMANPFEITYNTPPTISIFSPTQNGATPSNLLLNFTITKSFGWNGSSGNLKNRLVRVKILIDGQLYRSIEADSRLSSPFSYSEYLQDLADGTHTLALETFCEGWNYEIHGMWSGKLWYKAFSDLINFTVYANPPQILLLSVTNKTYEASDVPLVFTVNETFSQTSYSLDEQGNVTIGGNATLAGLSNGEHYITVYATDIAGNVGASETIYFNVEPPVPFATALAIGASGASVAVIGIGLLVRFKKRKRRLL